MKADLENIVGRIVECRVSATLRNGAMAFARVETATGLIEAVFFPAVYAEHKNLLAGLGTFEFQGRIEFDEETGSIPKKIAVENLKQLAPAGYRCPFCPTHADDEFVWHPLAEAYVCLGCQAEIDCGFEFEVQPTADDYNCHDTIARLLQHLGIDYAEARKRHAELVASGALDGRYIVVRV